MKNLITDGMLLMEYQRMNIHPDDRDEYDWYTYVDLDAVKIPTGVWPSDWDAFRRGSQAV